MSGGSGLALAALEALPEGLAVLDSHGNVEWLNPAARRLLGLSPDTGDSSLHLPGRAVAEDARGLRQALADWLAGGTGRIELSLRRDDGSECPVMLSGAVLPSTSTGEEDRIALAITDFSEQQELSKRLALARKMDALSSLAGGVAHDFNNLLTGILGNTSQIRAASADPEIDALARAVEDSAELAARLTQRLLALVRGQAPNRELLCVAELARHMLDLLSKVLPDTIRIEADFAEQLPPVLADGSQLQQAFMNLCINARDAMMQSSGGGRLRVTVREGLLTKPLDDGSPLEERAVVLRVEDDGPGIPEELRDRVFDPFFTTKGVGRGIGLGLSSVYQLAEAHGGTVAVRESVSGGAEFTLRLPASPDRELPTAAPAEERECFPTGSGETILVAEDERPIRELLERTLRAQGYEVLAASDGAEALALFKAHQASVALLFLDVRMPRMNGPDLLRAVRETHPHLPAIFSSGFIPEEAEKEEPMDWVLYLPKPYRLPQLFEIVRSALELDPIRDVSGEPTLRLDEELSTSRRRRDPEATTSRVPVFRAGQALDSRATLVGNAPVVPEDSEES